MSSLDVRALTRDRARERGPESRANAPAFLPGRLPKVRVGKDLKQLFFLGRSEEAI